MKLKINLLLRLLILFVCLNSQAQVLPSDSLALVSLANSTQQPFWNEATNWLTGPVDTWFGITVSGGRVTEIDLSSNALFGTLPPEIGDLDAVTHLNLSDNTLRDTIPSEIQNMTSLISLNLSGPNFLRVLPAEIGNMTNLEILNLNTHGFSGEIPFPLSNLVNLRELDLGTTESGFSGFSGVIDMTGLTQLELLNISGNRFENIPDFTSLPNLNQTSVEGNFLAFDDLEPNITLSNFTYSPQRILDEDSTVVVSLGDNVLLDALVGGSGNQYQWFKDSVAITGATGPTYNILGISNADEGIYYCEITSSIVPSLTISSQLFYVVENPFNSSAPSVAPTFTFSQLSSSNFSNYFQMSVNTGDLNNDGVDDIGFLLEDRLQIFFGGALQQTPDLEILVDPGFEMIEVRSADFNGDGFSDVAVSSVEITNPTTTSKIDFYFGSLLIDDVVDHTINVNDIKPPNDLNGLLYINFQVVGDVNNDGVEDFLINLRDTELYLYFGGPVLSNAPDQVLTGYDSNFGIPSIFPSTSDVGNRIFALDDINGDGVDDFAVSDFFRGNISGGASGVVIIHFGKSSGQISPDFAISLTQPEYSNVFFFGLNVESIKVNDDSFNDLVIAGVRADDDSVPGENGKELLFVYHGGPLLDDIPEQAQKIPAAPFGFNDRLFMRFYVAEIISIPDVTSDGKEELIFCSVGGGSPFNTNAYVLESQDLGNLANTPTKILEATNPNFSLGVNYNNIFVQRESAVGDFDADGTLDVVLSQPFDTSTFTTAYLYPLGPISNPTITIQPQDVTACENGMATFFIEASGGSLTYQWQESVDGGASFMNLTEGGMYSNVTGDSLFIDPVAFSANGYQYRCIVSGTVTSDAATLLVDIGNYAIIPQSISCSSSTFFVPIEAVNTVSSEVLGLDFCVQYDTSMMSPTGNAVISDVVHGGTPSYADYFINIDDSAGILNGVIFLTSAAPFPTYFSGNGTVIEIEFIQKPDFIPGTEAELSLCGVSEATLINGNIDHCSLEPAIYASINEPTFLGSLKFWDRNNKRLSYDTLNPGSFIPTTIIGVDSTCNPTGGTTFFPDLNGDFTYEVSEGDFIQISRDIPGDFSSGLCFNVMNWINGGDQNRAMRIATEDPSFTPSAYQIIAADVNMDGVVNAGDVTLIAARSVMSICGFPSATVEKDWLFIDQTTLDNDPSFLISGSYPADDRSGFSKNSVPSIPDCLPAPLDTTNSCISTMQEDYIAILLGDVNGNWNSIDGANLRTTEPQVTFQFENMSKEGASYFLPISIAEPQLIESFDLMFDFNTDHIIIEEMIASNEFYSQVSNVYDDHQFLFSSFSIDAIEMNNIIFQLKFTTVDSDPEIDDFENISAFINGSEVTTGTLNILGTEENLIDQIKVYPNPFSERITLELGSESNGAYDITITNASGRQVYIQENAINTNGKIEMDISHLSSGLYFLHINSGDSEKTLKIVK